jgi:hypothetical protein
MSRSGLVVAARVSSFLLVLAALQLGAGARTPASETLQFTGAWRDRDVRVDGVDEEWRDIMQPVKGQHFSVGFLNDADALYVCVVTKDETTIRQMARQGLVLWIDPAGGKKKAFGLRFPAGPTPGRRRAPDREGTATDAAEAPSGAQGPVDVLGPGKNDVREVENDKSGISARLRVRGDLLVFEMKVPLRKGSDVPFAPDLDPGAALRLELQTPEWRGPLPMRRGWPAVGVGVGRAGGGVIYPGLDTAALKPMDIVADLRLASAPAR